MGRPLDEEELEKLSTNLVKQPLVIIYCLFILLLIFRFIVL